MIERIESCNKKIAILGYSMRGRNVYRKVKALWGERVDTIVEMKSYDRFNNAKKDRKDRLCLLEEFEDINDYIIINTLVENKPEELLNSVNAEWVDWDGVLSDEIEAKLDQDDYPKTEIEFVVLSVGQACNLKCKNCGNLAPFSLKENMRYPLETLIKSVDNLMTGTYRIDTLQIQGGEPFLYSELKELISYIRNKYSREEIPRIQIATNGGILPHEEVLEVLKANDVIVRISDYGIIDSQKLIKLLDDRSISNRFYKFVVGNDKWFEIGGIDCVDNQVNQRLKVEKCEFNECFTIEKGILGRCSRSVQALSLQNVTYNKNDYVQLGEKVDRKSLMDYVVNKNPMECCKYCKGTCGAEMVDPAIQL